MSNIQANSPKAVPSFWTRLAYAIQEASESPEEQLERRVNRLEADVNRVSEALKKLTKS